MCDEPRGNLSQNGPPAAAVDGRLIRKEGPRKLRSYTSPGYFTLYQGDIGSKTTIIVNIHRTFALDSDLTFKMLERPPVGAVRIFGRAGEARELLLLAENQTSAETW